MVNMREGDGGSLSCKLGWNVPFDLARGLCDNAGELVRTGCLNSSIIWRGPFAHFFSAVPPAFAIPLA